MELEPSAKISRLAVFVKTQPKTPASDAGFKGVEAKGKKKGGSKGEEEGWKQRGRITTVGWIQRVEGDRPGFHARGHAERGESPVGRAYLVPGRKRGSVSPIQCSPFRPQNRLDFPVPKSSFEHLVLAMACLALVPFSLIARVCPASRSQISDERRHPSYPDVLAVPDIGCQVGRRGSVRRRAQMIVRMAGWSKGSLPARRGRR